MKDLESARGRIWIPDAFNSYIRWEYGSDPWRVGVSNLINGFHQNRDNPTFPESLRRLVSLDQQVDFYFDDHSSKRGVLDGWDHFVATRGDEVTARYGATPRFEKEEDFLPLQAADFLAWWVREGYKKGTLEKIRQGDFGLWQEITHIPGMMGAMDEDELTYHLITSLRTSGVPTEVPIYDSKHHPKPEKREDTPQETLHSRFLRLFRRH